MEDLNYNSDEREEGEIIEDDFEDISDDSTIIQRSTLDSGKSVIPTEPFNTICLSNTSSIKRIRTNGHRARNKFIYYEESPQKVCRKRRRRRRRQQQQTKSKGYTRVSTNRRKSITKYYISDSECETIDPKYAKQLHEALKHEVSEESLHNNLRIRLKPFMETGLHSEDELNLNTLSHIKLVSNLSMNENLEQVYDNSTKNLVKPDEKSGDTESKEPEIDPELQELRMAALKSFVLQNHERRKRRANNKHVNNSSNTSTTDIDKENDQCIINNDIDNRQSRKPKCDPEKNIDQVPEVTNERVDDTTVNTAEPITNSHSTEPGVNDDDESFDEDPDIMRAKLLASISKKLTSKSAVAAPDVPKTLTVSKPANGTPQVRNIQSLNKTSTNIFKSVPRISGTESCHNMPTINNNNALLPQSSTRITVKPLIININNDSDSDTEVNVNEPNKNLKATVAEFLKKQRAEVEATVKNGSNMNLNKSNLSTTSHNKSSDSLMDKSAVKLLPRSQQLEYRKLKQQLILAKKKTRLKRLSQRMLYIKKETAANNKKMLKFKTNNTIINNKVVNNNRAIKSGEVSDLQRTLDDMQILRNGRLQMKGKYRLLMPLMDKINRASTERVQHETEIRKLLQEIQKARTKLVSSHQTFTNLVQQLVNEKNKIDRCVLKMTKLSPHVNKVFVTSTPNKMIITNEKTNVKENVTLTNHKQILPKRTVPANELVNSNNCDQKPIQEATPGNSTENRNRVEEDPIRNVDEENLLDPNDITKVFINQCNMEFNTIPKYISPLDNRDRVSDPLTMLCPYDLLGICKDAECQYMHCS